MKVCENKKIKGSTKDDSELHSNLARWLKRQRMFNGLTRNNVAGRLGISVQQVQKYELAINRISAVTLYKYMKLLRGNHQAAYSLIFEESSSDFFDVKDAYLSEFYVDKDKELTSVMKLLACLDVSEIKGLKCFLQTLKPSKFNFEEE